MLLWSASPQEQHISDKLYLMSCHFCCSGAVERRGGAEGLREQTRVHGIVSHHAAVPVLRHPARGEALITLGMISSARALRHREVFAGAPVQESSTISALATPSVLIRVGFQ